MDNFLTQNIILRRITLDEVKLLQEICRQTFSETFSDHNTAEDLSKYLDLKFSEEKLTSELKNSNSEFFFAVLDTRIIGYLKINTGTAQTENWNHSALEIERIYVLKEFYGKKVGQMLLDKALQTAREKNITIVWLGVWEKNFRALGFYKKNGFTVFDKHIFRLGDSEQTDYMMKKILFQQG